MYKYGRVDIRSLQQILGHESIATTEIYTHVDDSQLQAAVNANPLAMMFSWQSYTVFHKMQVLNINSQGLRCFYFIQLIVFKLFKAIIGSLQVFTGK